MVVRTWWLHLRTEAEGKSWSHGHNYSEWVQPLWQNSCEFNCKLFILPMNIIAEIVPLLCHKWLLAAIGVSFLLYSSYVKQHSASIVQTLDSLHCLHVSSEVLYKTYSYTYTLEQLVVVMTSTYLHLWTRKTWFSFWWCVIQWEVLFAVVNRFLLWWVYYCIKTCITQLFVPDPTCLYKITRVVINPQTVPAPPVCSKSHWECWTMNHITLNK